MSHIGNKVRAGFFATPERQGEYIRALLTVEGEGCWLDPTCGEGEILKQIAPSSVQTYGVEIEKTRAHKATDQLTHCLHASLESMVIQNEAFSLLFLNPPYDATMKGMEDDRTERKEWTTLQQSIRYLQPGGVMIYIIPSYRFADRTIARFLSTQFEDIGMMRFSDEDYSDFRQCIFIGRKRTAVHKEVNQKLFDFLLHMSNEAFIEQSVTPIQMMVGQKTWAVPEGLAEIKTFYSKIEEKSKFVESIQQSKGFQAFKERTKPKEHTFGGDPILPINMGQLSLLLASGSINGLVGEGDHLHLVQGQEVVTKISETEEIVHDNGSKTIINKTRTKRDVNIKFITSNGLVRKLM